MRVPRELLRDIISVEDYSGAGAHGAIYGQPRKVRASFQSTSKLALDSKGVTVTVDVLVIIRPEDGPIRSESRVTDHETVYRVIQCYAYPNRRRPSQYEVQLSRWASRSVPGPGSGSGGGSGS